MAAPASLVFFGDSLTDNGNLFHLAGIPQPPYVNGIFSNGPTYAAPRNLPALLHLSSANFAYAGAQAHGTQVVAGTDINLGAQVARYMQQPHAAHTVVAFNIGSNDYLNYDPAADGDPAAFVQNVLQNIEIQALDLAAAGGVDEIVLFNLPNPALAPAKAGLTPAQIAGATAIIAGHNGGLESLAAVNNALGIHTVIVDIARLQAEFTNDSDTFGLKTTSIPFVQPIGGHEVPTHIDQLLRPDQIAYFDEIHPSAATHGIASAFAAATIQSAQTLLFNAGAQVVNGAAGSDFVFTGAGNDVVYTYAGNDTIFAGRGSDIAVGGDGNDLIAGGSGNDKLFGQNGSDLLAGNLGNDKLFGGAGNDVLIDGQGNDFAYGGNGNDLMIFKEDVLAATPNDFFNGGAGVDTVRVIVADLAYASLLVQGDLAAFGASIASTHGGVLASLGLTATNVERLEVYVQNHDGSLTVIGSYGHAAVPESAAVKGLLHSADLWGLL